MATAWSRVRGFLRRHKKAEKVGAELAEAAGMAVGWKIATRVLAVGIASAAVAVPTMIDLSNNNGGGAASAISASGVKAVMAKATEGLSFRDRDYPTFRAAAAKHRRAFGAYFFIHPYLSGKAQADYFLAYAKPQPGDLQPVVDSETGSPYSAAPATYAALHELTARGYRPILYASGYYLSVLVRMDPRLKAYRVWQAEYGPTLHRVAGTTVVAWQYTDRAIVAGRALDGSRLLASVASLTIPKPQPKKPPTPAQKRAQARAAAEAKLRARTGYWSWLAWYLHEGDWRPYPARAHATRPHAPASVPALWWRREHAFVRARA